MTSNAEKLYKIIAEDHERKQSLFRTALTNPKSAIDEICQLGKDLNLEVSKKDVIEYLSSLDDEATKLWLIKVRGGL